MTAAPTGWLTADDMSRLRDLWHRNVEQGRVSVDLGTLDRLLDFAIAHQAALETATDLPLSVAMQEARRRTEAGSETWVCLCEWDVPACLRYEKKVFSPSWRYVDQLVDGKPLWLEPGRFSLDFTEVVKCRLITPDEGEALLRGGE